MNDFMSADLATRLTTAHVLSARPDAPVVPEAAPRPARTATLRAALATELRTVARWVEPRHPKACQPS
ncbi:hypothetical protein [Nocardioides sp. T2.26MG-1]|uniref:hypothetical protein n=1 Tax=Nocardioides sp. T2.26MG-1 TaxID=3041166 RepID=UPI0024773819|nr:hypothetical protein [Nocardioides sp. T2.26MG-1]CAI9401868.1 hypothetical protein HIDPHFAB_00696 [Nocardioides sp. T2.26MG-1]